MNASSAAAVVGGTAREGTFTRLAATARAHPYLVVFVLALAVRVVIAVLASSYFSGRFVLDDQTYDILARDMAGEDTDHWDPFTTSLYWRTAAFLGPVTLIYDIFGPVKLAGQIFVTLLGAGAATLAVRLLSELVSRGWALIGGLVLALLPSQAFWSAMLMKDAAVWLALIGAAVAVAVGGRSQGRRLLLCGLGAALALCALAFLREHTLVVASWAVMIGALAGVKDQRVARISGAVVIGVTIPWFVASIGPAGIGLITDHGSLAERRFYNAVDANTAIVDPSRPPPGSAIVPTAVREKAATLTSKAAAVEAKAVELEVSAEQAPTGRAQRLAARAARLRARALTLHDTAGTIVAQATPPAEGAVDPNLAHLPRGLSVMLFEPLPVPFTGPLSLRLARLENLIWYPLLGLAAVGLWHSRRHLRALLMPLVAGAGILVMYALAEGNIGTAHRHRGEFVWVVVVLAVVGSSHLRSREGSKSTLVEGPSDQGSLASAPSAAN